MMMITTMIMIMIMMMNVIDLGLHDKGKLAKFATFDVAALDPTLQALLHRHHHYHDKDDDHDELEDNHDLISGQRGRRICVDGPGEQT